jgi:cytochrome bd ubiquinol oxidase subunit II
MPGLGDIWFLLIGILLLGYAILDGFDLGVGALHLYVARSDQERRTVLRSIGPVWDGNEVWLLVAGGALFAAFPLVYATAFSSLYLALILLLCALIFRAVSLEFRDQLESAGWRRAWDRAFSAGSALPALLFGVAVGNVVQGLPIDEAGAYTGGLIGLLTPFPLAVGLLSVALFVTHGASWLVLKTDGIVAERARRAAAVGWGALVMLWVVVTAGARLAAPDRWVAFDEPLPWLAPGAVVVALALFPILLRRGSELATFLVSALGITGMLATMGIGLYPNLLPATENPDRSLTIEKAASSDLTLTVMLVITAIGMPLVLLYTAAIYRHFRGKVRLDETGYGH